MCYAPIHSDSSDSIPVILDCFRVSSSLVYHLPAPGLAPLDCITFISFILTSLHIYILLYIVASSPVCAMTRLPAPNLRSLSQQAIPSLRLHERTSLGVRVSNTPTTRPFRPGRRSAVGFPPSLWAGHGSDNVQIWHTGQSRSIGYYRM